MLQGETRKHLDKLNRAFKRTCWDCIFIRSSRTAGLFVCVFAKDLWNWLKLRLIIFLLFLHVFVFVLPADFRAPAQACADRESVCHSEK